MGKKIALFIPRITDAEIYKDPGLISSALYDLGQQISIFCYKNYVSPKTAKLLPPIITISKKQAQSFTFWSDYKNGSVIIYSWLSLKYEKIIRAVKESGAKNIIKLDSDGQLIYPFKPSYLKVLALDSGIKSFFIGLARQIQWRIFPKTFSRLRIQQLELCDIAIIETQGAAEKLKESLKYWQADKLTAKIAVIPNPVLSQKSSEKKENLIIAVGRWNDRRKNSKVFKYIANKLPDNWRLEIIGQNAPKIKFTHQQTYLPHKQLLSKMATAKIIFAPSLSESYHLAAAEALAAGCSLAATPLVSFTYFSRKGLNGTIAKDFSQEAIWKALQQEIKLWDNDARNQIEISRFWRQELDPQKIGEKILTLC